MAMVVKNNMSAASTLNRLNKNSSATAKAMGRLSSGQKITGAEDDASGYSISEQMRVQIRGLGQDKQNLQNGISMAKVALGGMDEVNDSMEYLRELALGAANDTMTDLDRATSQKVVDQLIQNIDDIATETSFNGIPVLMPMQGGHAEYDIDADIVFVIDNTGSMGTPIAKVAEGISSFASSLRAFGANVRFGLVTFGDIREGGSAAVTKRMDFTEDEGKFAAAVRTIPMSGGGDEPESGLDGLMDTEQGVRSFKFRPGSAKHAVVVSDATFRNPEDASESDAKYTIPETVNAMRELGIQVDTIAPTYESKPTAYNEWMQIAEGTGGQYVGVNFSSETDYEGRLQELLKSFKIGETQDIYIQEGTKANDAIKLSIYDFRPQVLGLRHEEPGNPGRWKNVQINPRQAAVEALDTIDRALTICLNRQTTYGSYINRMEQSYSKVVVQEENVTGSESTIRDADMAKEMTNYTKHNVLQQASQSMLAQANQNLSSVLSLLGES